MNVAGILGILVLVTVAVGCYFLHKELVSGQYLKVLAYCVAILVVFVGILVGLQMIAVSAFSDRLPEFISDVTRSLQGKKVSVQM